MKLDECEEGRETDEEGGVLLQQRHVPVGGGSRDGQGGGPSRVEKGRAQVRGVFIKPSTRFLQQKQNQLSVRSHSRWIYCAAAVEMDQETTAGYFDYYEYSDDENITMCDFSEWTPSYSVIPVLYMLIFILGLSGNGVVISRCGERRASAEPRTSTSGTWPWPI
ncbi:hypothetical protein WMY93_024953 [Mugilogobius chulae]|uniref:Uncharacterized protein n=1 Tax=Mugilogobius chulae TaxID=88201 RepID=A0AAW0N4B5_9GOBI